MLDLLDYRRRVADMYRTIRELGTGAAEAHVTFRRTRDDLFRSHPESPLDEAQKATFRGLRYYDYDPAFRVVARVDTNVEPVTYPIELGADGFLTLRLFGRVTIKLPTGSGSLGLFWVAGYGGGVFLPFRDATSGRETYGGGRYLLDTIKGVDLGSTHDEVILDFNCAYNPSCHYNPRWVCPLALPESRLEFPVPVGEKQWTEA
jgi:uncharacterized protein (DUF1684 family)